MSMKRSEATSEKVTYRTHLLGNGGILLNGRTHKFAPTNGDLASMLIEANYQRDERFMLNTIVVLKEVTTTTEERAYSQPLETVKLMVEKRRADLTPKDRA